MPAQDEIGVLCQQARECVQRREMPQAVAAYEQALALSGTDPRPHEGLATIGFLTGDYNRAETHFKRLAQLDPRRADALINLACVYNRKQDFASAVKTLQQALSRNRKSAEAYYNLGIAHRGLNQLSMAVSAYKEAIRLAPEMAEAFQNLGNVYVEMGNLQQAQLNFHRALEINPRFEKARRGLEAAQQRVDQQTQVASPFGRLVDVAGMERRQEAGPGLRQQTSSERFADCAAVLQIGTAFANAGEALLGQLREELSPGLLGISHAFAQEDDLAQMHIANDRLTSAFASYRVTVAKLLKFGDEMQLHEESLKQHLARSAG